MGKHFSLSVITSKMFILLGKRRTLSMWYQVRILNSAREDIIRSNSKFFCRKSAKAQKKAVHGKSLDVEFSHFACFSTQSHIYTHKKRCMKNIYISLRTWLENHASIEGEGLQYSTMWVL